MLLTIVRGLTSFQFDVFYEKFDMLGKCLVASIARKVISYSLALRQQAFK